MVASVDPGDPAQPVHSVLPDGDAVLVEQLVGGEPIAQGRVVTGSLSHL
jgi:hypothetical protein